MRRHVLCKERWKISDLYKLAGGGGGGGGGVMYGVQVFM